MESLLLTTKLFIPPPRPDLTPRRRLFEILDNGLCPGNRLILVSSQAGSGKTTLLSSWIQNLQKEDSAAAPGFAWVSLDPDDNDPTRFSMYLIAAVQRVQPGFGQDLLQNLRGPQPVPIQAILISLLNEAAGLTTPLVLALDDYHVISNRSIHEGLAFFIEHLPPHLHLVLATRADPPIPLARLRAGGQMVSIRAQDLRFTREETAGFIQQATGLELKPEEVSALEARTEGWVVGLQMATLALKAPLSAAVQVPAGEKDFSTFLQSFSGSHRYLLDYLIEEVLDRQPAQIQTFLLQTSILDRLCASLCRAVLEEPSLDSQSILDYLERSNLFLIPLDESGEWYRYHHLFADLLRARLRQAAPTNPAAGANRGEGVAVTELHRRAAGWFEQNGLSGEAIQHALASQDFQYAARLVEACTRDILIRGQLTTLLNWAQALPPEVVSTRPWMCINHALALMFSGQLDGIEPLLLNTETVLAHRHTTGLEIPEVEAQQLSGICAVIRAFVADLKGDIPAARRQAVEADRLLPADDYMARALIPFILGRAYRSEGALAEAEPVLTEIMRMGHVGNNIWAVAVGACELATLRKLQGRLDEAAAFYQAAVQAAEARGSRHFGTVAKVDIGLSEVLLEQNQLERAKTYVLQGLEHLQGWVSSSDLVLAYIMLARVMESTGDLAAAADALDKAREFRARHWVFPQLSSSIDLLQVRLWLKAGRLAEVEHWLAASHPGEKGSLLKRESEKIAAARALLALGRAEQALEILDSLAEAMTAGERNGTLIEVLVLKALALQALGPKTGEEDPALVPLQKALALAQPQGYLRVFLSEGRPVQELLQRLRAAPGLPLPLCDAIDRLLEAFPPDPSAPARVPAPSAGSLIEPLTGRERDVLQLLARGLTNQEIGKEIFVATGTVKAHTASIFRKLDVRNRTEAVARARELEILSD